MSSWVQKKIEVSPIASLAETCKAGTCSRKSIHNISPFYLKKPLGSKINTISTGPIVNHILLFKFQDLLLEPGLGLSSDSFI